MLLLILLYCSGLNAAILPVYPDSTTRPFTLALAQARSGDTLLIHPGLYRESPVLIDKPLVLLGKDYPVFDGEGLHEVLIVRSAAVTIRGITIANSGSSFVEDKAGIRLEDARDCSIADCRFSNNFFALYLARSAHCSIRDNLISGQATRETTSGNGIHLWYCRDIEVVNNRVTGHRDGIYFEFARNGRIEANVSRENLRYGLHFMFSDSCRYRGNVFRDNGAGVAVMYTKHVLMDSNLFEHNWGSASFGLLLKDITDSHIINNVFSKNSIAVYAENSSRIVVEQNLFHRNGWAVKIMSNCQDNSFLRNSFVGNAFDLATNSRNNFSHFAGNYWSRYSGYDLDRDGLGDIPFRPVRLFSVIVEKNPPALILLRSPFVDMLDLAERVLPVLTPETLVDLHPAMQIHPLRLTHPSVPGDQEEKR